MKNKKLLVLVLAAFSVSAVGAFAATGCDSEETTPQHEHTYTWQSTADGHSGTCECGDETVNKPHVDVKNNATGEDGKDGKCDVCDYAIKQSVTFNVQGHGTAPAALNVDFGGKVQKPEDLDEDGYNFLGWYKDAAGNTPFNFDDPITDNTVIYAKWEENTTPGETPKNAHVLNIDEPNPHVLGSKGYSYYKYTATATGRYQIDLPLGVNNQKCYFTTDLDDGVYGNGQDLSTKYFDLDAEASVVIKLSCSEELPADAEVSVIISKVANEALPADGWFSGLYTNGSTSFIFDRENKQMSIEGVEGSAYGCSYIGGSFDTLTFEQGTGIYANSYKFVRKGDGIYEVSASGSTLIKASDYVCYPEVEGDFNIAGFAGIYALADGEDGKGLTDIVMRADGKGFYVKNGTSTNVNSVVPYEEYGMLSFGSAGNNYLISINKAEGNNVSIKVYNSTLGGFVIFERTGDLVDDEHSKLPITVASGSKEYAGNKFSVTVKSATQSWGDGVLLVTAFDETSNTYTIRADGTNYKLTVTGEGDEAEIKVYDATGATLLDTLTKYDGDVLHDLPTEANTTVSLPKEEFKKYFYFFKATESGWYSFNNTDENIEIYYDLPGYNHYDTEDVKTINGSQTVYLDANTIVGVKNVYEGEMPASVTFTVGLSDAPQGRTDTNPIVLTETTTIKDVDRQHPCYFEISAPGSYLISCYQGESNYEIYCTVNGTTYGYTLGTNGRLGWVGISGASQPYVHVNVAEGEKATIVVYRTYCPGNMVYSDITVTVAEDYSVTGNTLTLPEGLNSLSLENGKYKVDASALDDVTGIKLISTSDFTVTYGNKTETGSEITLSSYKLSLGFKLEAGSAAVNYTSVYKEGTQYNPKVIEKVGTQTNLTAKYLSITAPEDKDLLLTSYHGNNDFFYVTYNGVNYGFNYVDGKYVPFENSALKIPKGQTVVVTVNCANPDYTGSYSLDLGYDFSEDAIELDKLDSFTKTTAANGSMTITATYELTGTKNFCIPAIYGSKLTISCANGSNFDVLTRLGYTKNAKVLTYSLNDNSALQVLGYEGGNIYFQLSAENATTITFTQTLTAGSVYANPKEVSFATSATWSQAVSQTVRYFKLSAGTYNVSYSGPTSTTPKGYLILNGEVIESNSTITVEDGDVLIYKYAYASDTVTFKLPTISKELCGIYTYTVDSEVKKVAVGESTLTVDGVAYVLNSVSGNAYTFKHENDTLILTLSDGTMSIGGNALTAFVMFTEEQAKTYVGIGMYKTTAYEITLKINRDGTAEYTAVKASSDSIGNPESIMVSENGDNTYSFTYGKNYAVTFSFNDDGTLNLSDSSFTIDNAFSKAVIYKGTVDGGDKGSPVEMTLTFNSDFTKVSLCDGQWYSRNLTVTATADGYTFTDSEGDVATFTVSGDSLALIIDYYGTGTLTKQQ